VIAWRTASQLLVAAGEGTHGMIQGLFDHGALPTLERVVQFTTARQELLAHNVANLSTPHFLPQDVSPSSFQASLRKAVERRRGGVDPLAGSLPMNDTRELRYEGEGVTLRPRNRNDNILFHDRNNRDVERIMQDLAENTMTHRLAIDLLRNQFEMLRTAIRERV
jgi:flagellar basal-body rod protein FlgB